MRGGQAVLNFCANNYLGLADSPELIAAAKEGLDRYGYGMASVRFICGTQDVAQAARRAAHRLPGHRRHHPLLVAAGTPTAASSRSCWAKRTRSSPTRSTTPRIIDGIRLCKAKRFRYANNDLAELEARLKEADAAGARFKLIVTDGVFSMDGVIANLKGICDLADKYEALVMVDD